MAAVTSNINQERAMRVAKKRIEGFTKQFGEAHRNLARHAAFPLVLTPDLLYQIWATFVPEASWTAVAHVLLSRLCRQVGYEMYEMDIVDRNLLVKELKKQFGQERLDQLSEFLLDYVAQRLTGDDLDTQDLAQAQEWTALAYTKPTEVARKLANALRERVEQENISELLYLTSLVKTFEEPLREFGFEALLTYASAMNNFAHSNLEEAGNQIVNLPKQERFVEIAGVILPIPIQIPIDTAPPDRIQEDKAENIERAITAHKAELIVYTRDAFPIKWATIQNNLGMAYRNRIQGDKAENIEKAIVAYKAALTVYTRDAFPIEWARIQNNLGIAYRNRIQGNKAENLEKAIAAYEGVLTITTRDILPYEWATTQYNLGMAYRNRIQGDKAENIEKAIAAYKAALTVYTSDAFPVEWAEAQSEHTQLLQ